MTIESFLTLRPADHDHAVVTRRIRDGKPVWVARVYLADKPIYHRIEGPREPDVREQIYKKGVRRLIAI